MACTRVRSERQNEILSTIVEETVTTRLAIHNGLRRFQGFACHQEEYLFRVAEEMSGMRQDIRMVFDQVSSNDLSTRLRQSTYLERHFTTVKSSGGYTRNRLSSSNLPDRLLRMVRETGTMSLTRRYWFGLLNIKVISDTTWKESTGEDSGLDASTAPLYLRFIFVPPWWVSDTVIRVSMDSSMAFNVNRTQINSNPSLLGCLKACDNY